MEDSALLRQYVSEGNDDAFATLVTRHINLVYSVALRCTGSPENAKEITQAVFIILAKKAAQLRHDKALSSWLFQTARLTAANFMRSERRRRYREQEAHMQSVLNEPSEELWLKLAPLLDSAVANLREKDRQAILLRFYEGKNLREVGAALGTREPAAEKRVSRALDKLRKIFARRGITSTTAVLAETISTYSTHAAPAGLTISVKTVAVAKGAAISGSTLILVKGALRVMAWTKAQTAIIAGIGVVLVGTGTYETSRAAKADQQNQALRQQQTTLSAQVQQLENALDEATNRLAALTNNGPERQSEKSELLRLRGEVAQMQSLQREVAQLRSMGAGGSNNKRNDGGGAADSNQDMFDYLGSPVPAPANLNAAFSKDGLIQATQLAAQNAGIALKNIQVDDSEFPFVVGVVCDKGEFDKLSQQMKKLDGYQYGGSMSSDSCGAFSLTPPSVYAPGTSDGIYRRLIVRQSMLFRKMNAQENQTAAQ